MKEEERKSMKEEFGEQGRIYEDEDSLEEELQDKQTPQKETVDGMLRNLQLDWSFENESFEKFI